MNTTQRRQREKQARRGRIIEAAAALFARHGFESATMAEIARAAELAPGTLYLYFKSKDELYFAILEPQLAEHHRRNMLIADDESLPADQAIRRVLAASGRYYLEHPGMIRLLTGFHAQTYARLLSAEALGRLRELMRANVDVLAGLLRRGIGQGLLRPVEPVGVAILVWNMAMGVVQGQEARLREGKRDHGSKAVDAALELIMDGLKRRP